MKLRISKDKINWFDILIEKDINITLSVQDIADFSKRNGSVSKNIIISNHKDNHRNLEMLFETKSFDFVKKRVYCQVLKDNSIVFDNLNLTILGYEKKVINDETIITYNARVFDNVTDFYKRIDRQLVSDLDLSEYNHIYNANTIKNSFNNTYIDGYKYHLKYLLDDNGTAINEYNTENFHPAIYVRSIWDRIHQRAGYRYTFHQMNDSNIRFNDLLIPFTSDLKKILEDDDYINQYVGLAKMNINNITLKTHRNNKDENKKMTINNTDNQVVFNNNNYVSPGTFAINEVNFTIDVKGKLSIHNRANYQVKDYYDVYLVATLLTDKKITPYIEAYRNNQVLYTKIIELDNIKLTDNQYDQKVDTLKKLNNKYYMVGPTILEGNEKVVLAELNDTITFSIPLQEQDEINFRIRLKYEDGADSISFRQSLNEIIYPKIDYIIDIDKYEVNVNYNTDNIFIGSTVDMNYFLPNMQQNQFIDSIMKYANLYCEIDVDDPFNLIYKTRNEFYDSGRHMGDYTYLVDFSKGQKSIFIPDVQQKKVRLQYKNDESDPVLKEYTNKTENVAAEQIIIFDNDNIKGEKNITSLFSPTFNIESDFEANIPIYPMSGYRLLLDNGVFNCKQYKIKDDDSVVFNLTKYPFVSMQDKPNDPTFSIEYAPSDYYLYNNQYTLNNLFNNHFIRMYQQINNAELITVYMDIDRIIHNIRLSDRFVIENRLYYFNRIIDYVPGQMTKVELITADNEMITPRIVKTSGRIEDIDYIAAEDEWIISIESTTSILDQFVSDPPIVIDVSSSDRLIHNKVIDPEPPIKIVMRPKRILPFDTIINKNPNLYKKRILDQSIISLGKNNVVDNRKNVILVGDNWIAKQDDTLYVRNLVVDNIIDNYLEVNRQDILDDMTLLDKKLFIVDLGLFYDRIYYIEIDVVRPEVVEEIGIYKHKNYLEDDLLVYANRYYRKIDNSLPTTIYTNNTLPAQYFEEIDLGYNKMKLEVGYDIVSNKYFYVKDNKNNIIVNPNMNNILYNDWFNINIHNNVLSIFRNIQTNELYNNRFTSIINSDLSTFYNNNFDTVINSTINESSNNNFTIIESTEIVEMYDNKFRVISNSKIGLVDSNIMTGDIGGIEIDHVTNNRCHSILSIDTAVNGRIEDDLIIK